MKQHVGRARHRRRHERADDCIGCKRSFEFLTFEPTIEDRSCRAAEHLDCLIHVGTHFLHCARQRTEMNQVGQAGMQHVGRNLGKRRFDHRSNALQHRFIVWVSKRIMSAKLRDLFRVARLPAAEHQVASIDKRREGGWIALDRFESISLQIEIAHDLGAKEAIDVGCGRDFESGEGLLADACASDQVAAFEDKHAALRARQVTRRYQAVVTTPDHDRIIGLGHKAVIKLEGRPALWAVVV